MHKRFSKMSSIIILIINCIQRATQVPTMESKRQVVDTNKKTNDIDQEMVIESSEKLEVLKSFDDMGLREELLRGKNNCS